VAVDESAGNVTPSQRTWAVILTSAATVISMMDQTIANTALPTIAHDVNATAAASIWVINGFQLGLTVGIVPLAALGDIHGYWRMFRIGLIFFVLASLACSLSHTLFELTAARFIQGLGGAALTVSATPINRLVFPPNMLGRATGYSAMAVALGAAAGPVVGGAILAVASWQWLFALNVPIGIAIYLAAVKMIPKTPGQQRAFDLPSALTSVAMFGLAVFGLDALGHEGNTPIAAAELIGAVAIGWFFIRRQLATPLPMFAVDLFAQTRFTLAVVSCYTSFISQTIAFVALPFLFQTVMGYTPLQVGELLLPWLIAATVMAPISGPLADKYNSSRLAAIGLGLFTAGLVCATLIDANSSPLDIAWRMALCGIGYGLFQSPNNRAIQNSAPRERSGGPQAIQSVARVFGQATGAVIVATVFASDVHGSAGSSVSAHAVVLTMAIGAAWAAVATAAAVWRGFVTGAISLRRAA
jgi:MFS transporter, DHA2 family, multidrug resistance protein